MCWSAPASRAVGNPQQLGQQPIHFNRQVRGWFVLDHALAA